MRVRQLRIATLLIGAAIAMQVAPYDEPIVQAISAESDLVIEPIPEQQSAGVAPAISMGDLQRCLNLGACTLVSTADIGDAHIEVIQQNASAGLPSLHFITSFADVEATIWSLEDEHGGTFMDLTCALVNCILEIDVANEARVVLDMRIYSDTLQAAIAGAAMSASTEIYAVDLNADGVLDAAIAEQTIYADTPAPYFRTLVNSAGHLVTTGCTTPGELAALPTELLTRTCPQY